MNRVRGAVALEWTVEWRYRIPAVAAVVTVVWTLVLSALPAQVARAAGPVILTFDTATFGSFFVAALVLFERGEGAFAALTVSPLRPGEYVAAKIGLLTGLSVGGAAPVAVAAGLDLAAALAGVALLAVLFLALNLALVVRHRSLTGFLTVAPLPLVPLIAAPLARLTGLVEHPLLFVVPTTAAADLVRGVVDPGVLAYSLLAVAGVLWFVRRRVAAAETTEEPSSTARGRVLRARWRPRGGLAALAGIDRRTSVRSALVLVVLAGPVLLAIALRVGYPPLAGYVHTRFGLALTPYRPLLLACLVVLHVPLIVGMVGALLVLDDVDDRTVLVLRGSPLGARRYLAYRAVATVVVTAAVLAVAVPVSGFAPGGLGVVSALLLASAQAPLVMFAATALARNEVEGLGWLKILGLSPSGIPLAMWWLPEPFQWPLRVLPHYWTVHTLWHPGVLGLLAGAVVTAAAAALLASRTLHRFDGL